jgi:hypothetical protein
MWSRLSARAFSRQQRLSSRRVLAQDLKDMPLKSGHCRLESPLHALKPKCPKKLS